MAFGAEKQESSAERVCVFFSSQMFRILNTETQSHPVSGHRVPVFTSGTERTRTAAQLLGGVRKNTAAKWQNTTGNSDCLLCFLGLAVFDYFVCLLLLHICWLSHVAVIFCHLVFRDFFWFVFVFYKLCFSFMFIIVLSSLLLYNVACGCLFVFLSAEFPNLCCPERKGYSTIPGQQGALCRWEGCRFPNYKSVNCKKYPETIIWR